jgi:hypothetical protein
MARLERQSAVRATRELSFVSDPIALDGFPYYEALFIAETSTAIRIARYVHTEAAAISGDTVGVIMMLGTITEPTKFATWTTGVTVSLGTVVTVPVNRNNNFLAAEETLILRSQTGKARAGIVVVQVDLNEVS